jgi:MoaA/NifB/PqqE/SkfB family radical SAM enzyme
VRGSQQVNALAKTRYPDFNSSKPRTQRAPCLCEMVIPSNSESLISSPFMGGEYDLVIIDYIAQIITPRSTPPPYSEISQITTDNQISHQGCGGGGGVATHPPCVLSHLATAQCNCRSDICLWWDHAAEEMNLEEIERIYGEARRQEIVLNYIWGGEPLIRADIAKVMVASKRNGFITLLNTNGYFLAEWLSEQAEAMDLLVVSIDYPSDYHDELRKCKGLYNRALEGIERTKSKYPNTKLIIDTIMAPCNYEKIEELVALARDLGASIFLSPMETNGRHSSLELLSKARLTDEEVSQASVKLLELKMKGYPINNSVSYFKAFIGGKKPFSCHYPQLVLTANADGQVPSCLDRARPLGYLLHMHIKGIYNSTFYRTNYLPHIRDCCRCNNSDVVDTSFLWELRLRILWEAISLGLR